MIIMIIIINHCKYPKKRGGQFADIAVLSAFFPLDVRSFVYRAPKPTVYPCSSLQPYMSGRFGLLTFLAVQSHRCLCDHLAEVGFIRFC